MFRRISHETRISAESLSDMTRCECCAVSVWEQGILPSISINAAQDSLLPALCAVCTIAFLESGLCKTTLPSRSRRARPMIGCSTNEDPFSQIVHHTRHQDVPFLSCLDLPTDNYSSNNNEVRICFNVAPFIAIVLLSLPYRSDSGKSKMAVADSTCHVCGEQGIAAHQPSRQSSAAVSESLDLSYHSCEKGQRAD
jgi:hypothetical protein